MMTVPKLRARHWVATFAVVGPIALAVATSNLATFVSASPSDFDALRDVLASGGIVIDLPSDEELAEDFGGKITAAAAAKEAVTQFGKVHPPTVFQALVTVTDVQPAVERSPMYVVKLTGLSMPPMGKNNGSNGSNDGVPASAIHHELIVFVDAASGEYLFAVTAR